MSSSNNCTKGNVRTRDDSSPCLVSSVVSFKSSYTHLQCYAYYLKAPETVVVNPVTKAVAGLVAEIIVSSVV